MHVLFLFVYIGVYGKKANGYKIPGVLIRGSFKIPNSWPEYDTFDNTAKYVLINNMLIKVKMVKAMTNCGRRLDTTSK